MFDFSNKFFEGKKIGFAVTASHCTFEKAIVIAETFVKIGAELIPIMSENAYETDTRFGRAKAFADKLEMISGRSVIHTILDAEPIGPKKMTDVMLVCPCTGNTMAKLAGSITDTAVVYKRNTLITRKIKGSQI